MAKASTLSFQLLFKVRPIQTHFPTGVQLVAFTERPNVDTMNEESSIVYLLKKLRDDTTTLVRDEISLAKTEISEKIASTSRNVGYLAVGALVAYAALMLSSRALAYCFGISSFREV